MYNMFLGWNKFWHPNLLRIFRESLISQSWKVFIHSCFFDIYTFILVKVSLLRRWELNWVRVRPRFIFHNYKIESYITLSSNCQMATEWNGKCWCISRVFFIFNALKSFQAFVDYIFVRCDALEKVKCVLLGNDDFVIMFLCLNNLTNYNAS